MIKKFQVFNQISLTMFCTKLFNFGVFRLLKTLFLSLPFVCDFTVYDYALFRREQVFKRVDTTCVLIGQQVCFHSAMKHENDVSNNYMAGCLQNVRIYNFIKEMRIIYRLSLC